jgi:hypothetical protein
MLNKPPSRPCRFPRLVFRNYTASHYQGVKFLGPPVRILQTILQWPAGVSPVTDTWFTN